MENTTTEASPAKGSKKQGIWNKLLDIQKAFATFAQSEDSGKKARDGQSEYKYTPGWLIIESLRKKMDALGLMLLPQFSVVDTRLIDYPVYKLINGKPMAFEKKEMYVTVNANFTWLDTDSGETAGPFNVCAAGANGTDKGMVSAISFAERYFLLKFFHITTRENVEEPDAVDSDALPGIPAGSQPMAASGYQAAQAGLYGQNPSGGFPGAAQPQQPPYNQGRGAAQVGNLGIPAGPAQQFPQQQPFTPQQGQQTPMPPAGGPFNPADQVIIDAAAKLANYEKGTPTFQQGLNATISILAAKGYNAYEPGFTQNLAEMAQSIREGKFNPSYQQ
jgi:hypothetical protein